MSEKATTLLAGLREKWEGFAALAPFWAVWTDAAHKGRRWDPLAFYELGEREVARLLAELAKRNHKVHFSGTALDFGCGVGRLTRPLARRFEKAVGLDISPTMVAVAQSHTLEANAEYLVNGGSPLPCHDKQFDFVLTRNTLQHMPPPLIEEYLGELVRVLSDDGLLVFRLLCLWLCLV